MRSRRAFLRLTGGAAGAAFATARYGIDEVAALTQAAAAGGRRRRRWPPTRTTGARSSSPFTLDRTIINLNNGNSCPGPDGRPRGLQALQRLGQPGAGLSTAG